MGGRRGEEGGGGEERGDEEYSVKPVPTTVSGRIFDFVTAQSYRPP